MFRNAARKFPESARAHLGIGRVLAELGRAEDSKDAFKRVVELDKRFAMDIGRAMNELLSRAVEKGAPGAFESLLRINPCFTDAWVELGKLHSRNRDHKLAMKCFSTAMKLDGSSQSARTGFAESERIWKEENKCPECTGSGKCRVCKGSMKCQVCEGSANCHECGGSGKCPDCRGTRKCAVCKGSGKVGLLKPCATCEGSGKCQVCSANGVCGRCDGKGKCKVCRGSRKCRVCAGTGGCEKCGGSGVVEKGE